jgi:XTP/dITP diphosphohydrolase
MEAAGLAAIADDSGIVVEALGGAPGVYSARYGGCGTDEERLLLLLKNMENEEHRAAKFVSNVAVVFPNGDELVTAGECAGELTREARGENGFGYDPIFYMPCFGRTLAEVTAEEKNAVSHRGKALRAMKEKLEVYFKENHTC